MKHPSGTTVTAGTPALGTWLLVGCVAALALACNQPPPKVVESSGEQAGYAEHYPSRLGTIRSRFADEEGKAKTESGEFKSYPEALKNPDLESTRDVYELADSTGKSSAYTEAALEAETVTRFMDEEKDGLHQKVAGGVNYAATQKNCSEDLGGVAASAMDRGVEKQLDERLRKQSEVHRYIEDHQDKLGKANLDTLNKQADHITHASHVVHVRLELYRRELEALLEDQSTVRSTLDRTIKDSDAVLADAGASKPAKTLAQKRKAAAEAAQKQLDAEVEQAQRAVTEMQQRNDALKKEYEDALEAMNKSLEEHAAKK
ncbi:MAG TPA: hypothetical protein VFQ61_28010 [Polyangiaceae bacterium]|nr:hypothetical protein [Polyangiaceae bacterium]